MIEKKFRKKVDNPRTVSYISKCARETDNCFQRART